MDSIGFNKPYISGKEIDYIKETFTNKKLSGNGKFTKLCQDFFCEKYSFKKTLLTNSCTDALEMCALLIGILPGDEVILPSYTFVSTANAFALRGAVLKFCDSSDSGPNIDPKKIEQLISPKTKAIIVMHYAGVACDMDKIMNIAERNQIWVIEDAAQSINSFYDKKPLGGIGHLGTFSFHETKNVISGEGGLLIINDPIFIERAEIIWEKGTNRSAFFRGEVNKYNWVDLGSSFLPSEITAAFLYAQLENLGDIQNRRVEIHKAYQKGLEPLSDKGYFQLPELPEFATNNAHMFYLICNSKETRDGLIKFLAHQNINAVFHYLPLHKSPFFLDAFHGERLEYAELYADRIIRLPFFYEISANQIQHVVTQIEVFFGTGIESN